jgi:thiamine kinase-like enzyme
MDAKEIADKAREILGAREAEVEFRLMGGMSNYTYVVRADGERYTFRLPGEYSEYFVDRELEKANLALMEKLGITNETVYLDVESGIKIARYIEGEPLSTFDSSRYPYEEVARILKIIHSSDLRSPADYEPFARLERYERYIKDLGFVHPARYNELRAELFAYRPYLETQKKTLTHGDSQPSNFVRAGDGLIVVDFEFCGNNDPLYDVACFANKVYEEGLNLLRAYFPDPSADEKKRFHLWRAFQCAQWYNVAVFKELKGMSATLKIDFARVAENYLRLIAFYLEKTALLAEK